MFEALRIALSHLRRLQDSTEHGASAVEYGLLVALIAAVIFGTVATLGQGLLTDLAAFLTSWR